MSRHESDIGYLIGGLLLGGFISGPIGYLVPDAEFGVRLGIGAFGCLAGIGIGYLLAWNAKQAHRKRVSRTIQSQIAAAPPAVPTQIAGKKCSVCKSHIVFAPDGSFCVTCIEPFCNSCKDQSAVCATCAEEQPV